MSLNIANYPWEAQLPPALEILPQWKLTVGAECVHGVLGEDRTHLAGQIGHPHLEAQWGDWWFHLHI